MVKRCLGCMELYSDEYSICPHCGYADGTGAEEAVHMVPGALLHDRYIVGKSIGYGGFGVTYIAWDNRLEQKVAIKEYLPGEFSTRMPGQTHVTIFNGEKREQFHDGLKKFIDEAKKLAKFQNEQGIVKVFDSFEENTTAYIVMELLEGETLTAYLNRVGKIQEDEAIKMLTPVMESLNVVHKAGILHRDIAPDNIFLTSKGEVKLIDFGASRFATTSHSRSLTVIIKPGYSPEEQYRSNGDQGPHTDVYSLGATLYKMITGVTPAEAMERRANFEKNNKDILVPVHKLCSHITINRENAILNAMNVRIEDRTEDIPKLLAELNATGPLKRRGSTIRKIDVYSWPLWLKILIPSILAVIAVVGVLIGTGVIEISFFKDEVEVPEGMVVAPDVEQLTSTEAIKLIEESSLKFYAAGSIESEYVEAGKIVLQTPVGGTFIGKGETIELTISDGVGVVEVEDGMATVPNVTWNMKDVAIQKLLDSGLTYEIVTVPTNDYDPDMVIEQSTLAREKVPEGTKITIKVATKVDAKVIMPDVLNMNVDEAESRLKSLGLNVTRISEETNGYPHYSVFRTDGANSNAEIPVGHTITLYYAVNTYVEVPDLYGKSSMEAMEILKSYGLEPNLPDSNRVPNNEVPMNYVFSQNPAAGTQVKPGALVDLYVSSGSTNNNSQAPAPTYYPQYQTTQPQNDWNDYEDEPVYTEPDEPTTHDMTDPEMEDDPAWPVYTDPDDININDEGVDSGSYNENDYVYE